jgi:hypothetical protein
MMSGQALSSLHDVEVPSTVHGAEKLLHLGQAQRNTCELKKTAAVQRLHTALLYVQMLRKEVETAEHTLSATNEDLGRVRAAIREAGLPVKYHCVQRARGQRLCLPLPMPVSHLWT